MVPAREALTAALEDVRETEVPEDLRVVAFSKVFDLRAGPAQAPVAAATKQGLSSGVVPHAYGDPMDGLEAIAAKIGTDRDTVAEVFDFRDGKLELVIAAGKLASATAAGAKEIALLVAGGRQAAGMDEWTSLDVVREICAESRSSTRAISAKTIKSMSDEFNVRKESERKMVVRVSRPGWEAFSRLVLRLSGGA